MGLYRNDAAQLVLAQELQGVEAGGLAWGDYDGDGDLDLAAGGIAEGAGPILSTTLYRNDGGQLTATEVALPGIQGGDLAWGDYDNDQDLDLIITGNDTAVPILTLYENRFGDFVLDPIQGLEGVDFSAVSWADFDGDGDLDLFSSGRIFPFEPHQSRTHITVNLEAQQNPNWPPEAPLIPEDAASDSADTVVLRWLAATDEGDSTPQSLTYNLRVGTNPGAGNVLSGAVGLGLGTVGTNLFHRLTGLASGTYFWSAQTVDDGLARSPWTAPQPFVIDTVPPVVAGTGDDPAASEIRGFNLNPTQVGIGQSVNLGLVFIDRHSGVDQQALPVVTATIEGQAFRFETLQFTGETWNGQLNIDASMPSGTASISVRDLVDLKANPMVPFDSLAAISVDTQIPVVIERFPEAGATDVHRDLDVVTMVFSEPLEPSTLSADNFQLKLDGTPLPLRVEAAENAPENTAETTVLLVLEEALRPGTQYTVEISAAIHDLVGNRPLSALSWTFNTRIPAVARTDPAEGAIVAAGPRRLEVVFSSPVNRALVLPVHFRLSQDGRILPLERNEFLYDDGTFTVRFPRVELLSGSVYEAAVLPGIGGPGGLDRPEWRWSFATNIPQFVSSLPADGAEGVSTTTTTLQIGLSGPVARQDPEAIQLRVRSLDDLQAPPEWVAIAGFGADSSGVLLRFSPLEPLEPFSQYEVVVDPRLLGTRATAGFSWTFSTAGRLEDPARGGRMVNAGGDVELYFPPNALAAGAGEVAIRPLAEADLAAATTQDGSVQLGPAYRIDAGSNPLGKKVTLTMRYSAARAEEHRTRRLGIFQLESNQQWQWVGGTVDADKTHIRTAIDRLGTYAVFAAEPADGVGPAVADLSCQPRILSPRGGGFAARTEISFTLGETTTTSVKIFDMEGHLVRRLVENEPLLPGSNVITWDGRNEEGQVVYEGPYVVLVEAGGKSAKKIVIVVNGQR